MSSNGFRYYISFVDHCTRFTWIVLLKAKSEALNAFILFKKQVELQTGKRIKMVQTDGGGESKPFASYLATCGVILRHSCPHTHEQNGILDCKHCHIVETCLTLLAHASIPLKYWDESFLAAVHMINKLPSSVL